MYSTCLFCHGTFKTNARFERLSVGRRFAFDMERGRLWIVCNRCGGWNLWPFETRWEGLEELAQAFSRARRRVSTDEITLARVSPGLDLIRVGKPTQAEFASWRYVNRIRRRRRLRFVKWSLGAAGAGLAMGEWERQ